MQAARLAIGFRQAFGRDVFIDLVCYRRHGHNELDDPTFTQPVMYEQIREHPSVAELYGRAARRGGRRRRRERVEAMPGGVASTLDAALAAARERMPRQKVFAFGGVWKGLGWAGDDWSADTRGAGRAPARDRRRDPAGCRRVHAAPALANAPRGAPRDGASGARASTGAAPRRWRTAASCSRASPVRLSGQDTVRGTFSHRHAVLFDAEDRRAVRAARPSRRASRPRSRSSTARCARSPCSGSSTAWPAPIRAGS